MTSSKLLTLLQSHFLDHKLIQILKAYEFSIKSSIDLKEYSGAHFKNDYIEPIDTHKVKRPEITKQSFYEV